MQCPPAPCAARYTRAHHGVCARTLHVHKTDCVDRSERGGGGAVHTGGRRCGARESRASLPGGRWPPTQSSLPRCRCLWHLQSPPPPPPLRWLPPRARPSARPDPSPASARRRRPVTGVPSRGGGTARSRWSVSEAHLLGMHHPPPGLGDIAQLFRRCPLRSRGGAGRGLCRSRGARSGGDAGKQPLLGPLKF